MLLALIAPGKVKAHLAAVIALVAAICIAIWAFPMPALLALRASMFGLAAVALACLVGVFVMLQAYVFTGMIIHP